MKKLYTLAAMAAFLMTSLLVDAQSQRMGFVEEATQASCPPCATLNPGLQTLMNSNSDKVLFLAYQVWWPGFDQMYLDNQEDVNERVGNYYDFGFAPQLKFNGTFPGGGDGSVPDLTQAMIDEHNTEMSEFDLALTAEFVDGSLNVTGSIDATMAASGNLKLHLVLTEGTIYATQATGGTNGETEYHHVMKKFLPGTDGISLSNSWAIGDSYTINETYSLNGLTIYNWDDLEVIAFIQNDDDKFVHQAAKASSVPTTLNFTGNAAAGNISGLPDASCSADGSISPSVTVQNLGTDDMTSLDVTYDVNGGTPAVYNWTGSVASLESVEIELPAYDFTSMGTNSLNVSVSNPNGAADGNEADNANSIDFELEIVSDQAEEELTLTLLTDCWPGETGWELRSISSGAVIASAAAGTYTGEATEYVENITAPAGDCYEFVMTDTFGDGLNGSIWVNSCSADGSATLTDASGDVLYNNPGTVQYSEDGVNFSAVPVGLEENYYVTEFNTFPNPVVEELTINFSVSHSAYTTIDVVNAVGQVVSSRVMGDLPVGEYNERMNMSDLSSGLYMIRITSAGEVASKRVTVAK